MTQNGRPPRERRVRRVRRVRGAITARARDYSSVYLTRLALENVRAFENLELSFASAGQPRMTDVVIGRNGTGKSTLLRYVVL